MNEVNNDELQNILFDISKKNIIPKFKNLKKSEIQYKNINDLVTSVDIKVEEELKDKLTSLLPNSLFVGEEIFSRNPKVIDAYKEKKFCWTVDPIDGTTNFTQGKEKFATMIALSYQDKILQSWIYKPLTEEFSYAILNGGAYINSKKILISANSSIHNSIGSISFKYWEEKYEKKMKNLKIFFKNINSYRCIGFEYIDIVKGIRDFAILSKVSVWDHIAGILILREAGGVDMHFDNSTYNHCIKKNNLIVSSSKILQNEIINLIKEN